MPRNTTHSVRPPATGRKLKLAIEHAQRDLSAYARSRDWENEAEWSLGALIWKVLLDLSVEGSASGIAPTLRKNDLAYELKRHTKKERDFGAKLWKTFLKFHRSHARDRLLASAAKPGMPILFAERASDGIGGDPDKTEATYWLCFDIELPLVQPSTSNASDRAHSPDSCAAIDTTLSQPKAGSNSSALNISASNPATSESSPAPQSPATTPNAGLVEGQTVDAGSRLHAATTTSSTNVSDVCLIVLATRPQRATSQTTMAVTLALLLVIVIPTVTGAAADLSQPLQTLAETVNMLIDVFNGSMLIRT